MVLVTVGFPVSCLCYAGVWAFDENSASARSAQGGLYFVMYSGYSSTIEHFYRPIG